MRVLIEHKKHFFFTNRLPNGRPRSDLSPINSIGRDRKRGCGRKSKVPNYLFSEPNKSKLSTKWYESELTDGKNLDRSGNPIQDLRLVRGSSDRVDGGRKPAPDRNSTKVAQMVWAPRISYIRFFHPNPIIYLLQILWESPEWLNYIARST